jgi:hypothetical protein
MTKETCGHRTTFDEWICDAPADHPPGQHYYVKPDRVLDRTAS